MKVSIITPVFNNVNTVEHCIKSVLSQSFNNIEYIIVDGGSTDGTLDIIKKYQNRVSFFISEPDNGIYDALNKGLKLATGDIIGILHSDDFYDNDEVVRKVASFFETHNINTCYGDLCYVSRNNPEKIIRYWRSGEFNIENFKKGWMPPHPTFFVKREVYNKFGAFDLSYKISSDYELMVRFLYANTVSAGYIPELLVRMRMGGKSNKNLSKIILKMKEDYQILKKYSLSPFKTLFLKNINKLPQFITMPNQK